MLHSCHDCLERSSHWLGLRLSTLLLALFCLAPCLSADVALVHAQGAKKADDKKPKLPPSEKHVLITKDRVSLHCRFYPGTLKKEAIPIMLIHGWDGRGSQFASLAVFLQQRGHAVIVPDMRGHGLSTAQKTVRGVIRIRRERMNKQALLNMIWDLEACKKFLKRHNNAGQLNLEQLCIVGADIGALVALEWSVRDWNAPRLPSLKQGQDVKALVLLSPSQASKGLTVQNGLNHPFVRKLSTMIITGKQNSRLYSDARRIHARLEKYHADPPEDRKERLLKQDLFLIAIDTDKQGVDLLSKDLKPNPHLLIANFILYRLEKRKEKYPWSDRTNPFSESN